MYLCSNLKELCVPKAKRVWFHIDERTWLKVQVHVEPEAENPRLDILAWQIQVAGVAYSAIVRCGACLIVNRHLVLSILSVLAL